MMKRANGGGSGDNGGGGNGDVGKQCLVKVLHPLNGYFS